MRKFIVVAVALVVTLSAVAEEIKWVDATELGIHGHTQKTDKSPYYRFDCTPWNFTSEIAISHAKKPAGLYLLFKSNTSQIWASWENVPEVMGDNMTGILQHGLDLYIKADGKWKFAAAGRVSTLPEDNKNNRSIIRELPEGENEFLLYLPIWCEMTSLKLGVNEGATIEGLPSPFRHKVIVHGSSITHGASASRPGLTYTALMSRHLGIDFINFGFSGECKMQPEFLAFLKSVEADAFIFDAFSNPSPEEIEERLENFVTELVKAHPGKPLIFFQCINHYSQNSNYNTYIKRKRRCEIATRIMTRLAKEYKDVYFIDEGVTVGEDGTIDNAHPNDLGFYRFVNAYEPKVAKILKKYGIK